MRKSARHDSIIVTLDLALRMRLAVQRIARLASNASKLALKNQLAGQETQPLNPPMRLIQLITISQTSCPCGHKQELLCASRKLIGSAMKF